MSEHPETTLFKSPLIHIIEHRCQGEDTRGSDEEAASDNQISFPRFGIYQKRSQMGEFLVDPNYVSFFQKEQSYQVHHPVKDHISDTTLCDISTIFEIPDDVLDQMLNKLSHYSKNEPTFPNTAVKVLPAIKAYQYFILNVLNHLQSDEYIEFEEVVLDFLYAVLAVTNNQPTPNYHCCKSPRSQIAHAELIDQVKLVIGKDFRSKLSLNDISQQVHHSPFSLARIFKNHTGITIHKYLLRTRLLHSLEQIMTSPSGHIGQIGVDFGFATPSHFATSFLGEFNMSPSVFRQQTSSKQLGEISNFLKA